MHAQLILRPIVLSKRPVEEAVTRGVSLTGPESSFFSHKKILVAVAKGTAMPQPWSKQFPQLFSQADEKLHAAIVHASNRMQLLTRLECLPMMPCVSH